MGSTVSSDTRLWRLGKFSLTHGISPQTGAFDVQGVLLGLSGIATYRRIEQKSNENENDCDRPLTSECLSVPTLGSATAPAASARRMTVMRILAEAVTRIDY